MELIKKVYMGCDNENKPISKNKFLREAQHFSQLTPYEINILYAIIKTFRNDE